ncbi:alkaline phosphatase family protein [Massilia horti]|uniref:Phospholipase C n=1 Tax=Massilia horti TaxID=2562153 RepID=A0A4Y9T6J2_9BURK|nr:alkaline phosphatase family protein [Massilia horti]TFW36151.1 hypothetical protein E4O92_00150 [Massilia horti]
MFQISVVNRSHTVSDAELHRVVRAINRQIKEDFEPYWGFGGTLRVEGPARGPIDIRALTELRGDAILYIVDSGTSDDMLGYHERNLCGIPYGFVYLDLCAELGDPWSATLSHEALELLGDPQANLLVLGPNPAGSKPAKVYHWFEMCDAVQAQFYQIDEVTVSNFVLPSYFSPNDGGGRTNFSGTPLEPFKAAPGGYIGFFKPGREAAQQFFGDRIAEQRYELKKEALLPVGDQPCGRSARRQETGIKPDVDSPAREVNGKDPIRHVVVLMLENRSFDHVLGGLQGAIPGLDGVDPKEPGVNVDAKTGKAYEQLPIARDWVSHSFKVPHEFDDVTEQLQDHGAHFVNSFVRNRPNSTPEERQQVMAYFKDGDLPVTHALAKKYLVCNRWFSSLPGPTWPNRFFVHSGTSLGNVVMPSLSDPTSLGQYWGKFSQPTIYDRLDEARVNGKPVSWRIYHDGFPQSIILDRLKRPFLTGRYSPIENFVEDAKDEKNFPDYVFIEPRFLGGFFSKENDQHPPVGMLDGERLLATVYNAIRSNKDLWHSTLLVLTYDEHGGFYDHVVPPAAIAPDNSASKFAFNQLGVRVPAILISPWLPAGCDDTVYDHTSILSYLLEKYALPPLGERTQPLAPTGFASRFLQKPREDGDTLAPFGLDGTSRRGAMAGREPAEPDEGQLLLLAMAEQLRRHDKAKERGAALPSVPSDLPSLIPSDAYRFARHVDTLDEWLQTRDNGGARPHAPRKAGSRTRASAGAWGMGTGPVAQHPGLKGIDVWAGTGKIEWEQVKASGIDFVYVRAAYGTHPDKFALANINGAKDAGLACGVYHFLRTSEDYRKQIDLMLKQLDLLGVGKGDLPPALDVEDNPQFDGPWNAANNDAYLTALRYWIDDVRKKTGDAAPVLYTRASFWQQLGNPDGYNDCPLWIAHYTEKNPRLPRGWQDYKLWQYSESGRVPGIAVPVDLNSFPGTMAELRALMLK